MSDRFLDELRDHWADTFQTERNRLGFAMRNFLRAQICPYTEKSVDKQLLFLNKPAAQQVFERLSRTYDLLHLIETASHQRFLETLTYLEWLDLFYQAAPFDFQRLLDQPDPFHWLDAGAKNWHYVEALVMFIRAKRAGGSFKLDGVELDPNRRYQNLTTRGQTARFLIRNIPEACYHEGNLQCWTKPSHLVSHFLPFVFSEPHMAWGLPQQYFQPEKLLAHLLTLLTAPGMILIVNQGETESKAQEQLLKNSILSFEDDRYTFKTIGQLPAHFIKYQYPRYGWLCIKSR